VVGVLNRLRTAEAVLRLVGSRPLSDHQRRTLAALIAVLGAVPTKDLETSVATAYGIAVEALAPLQS
jgi:hypothetical protein